MTNLPQPDSEDILVPARSLREWWNRIVPLRIKYLVTVAACVVVLVAAFQWQTSKLSEIRQADFKRSQTTQCYSRVESRDDLRAILFYVVDLTDIIPDSEAATLYTLNRTTFINHNYPALSDATCDIDGISKPVVPIPPTQDTIPTEETNP